MGDAEIFFEDVHEGDKIPKLVKGPITEIQLVMYAGASGDFNPIHTVHSFGVKAGFGGVIAHGMLSMAYIGQLMTDWVGNKALKRLSVQFKAIVRPGDIITCGGTVTKKYFRKGEFFIECDLVAKNQRDEEVVIGRATAALPSKR